ncbi:hypothetical protein [uncultured Kordia sp.]|nr:hypothetical protein [uncultured Kordia sp.]
MKTTNLKSLELKKKSIASITSNEVKGGLTTIQNITRSCPHICGSKK